MLEQRLDNGMRHLKLIRSLGGFWLLVRHIRDDERLSTGSDRVDSGDHSVLSNQLPGLSLPLLTRLIDPASAHQRKLSNLARNIRHFNLPSGRQVTVLYVTQRHGPFEFWRES